MKNPFGWITALFPHKRKRPEKVLILSYTSALRYVADAMIAHRGNLRDSYLDDCLFYFLSTRHHVLESEGKTPQAKALAAEFLRRFGPDNVAIREDVAGTADFFLEISLDEAEREGRIVWREEKGVRPFDKLLELLNRNGIVTPSPDFFEGQRHSFLNHEVAAWVEENKLPIEIIV